MRLPYPEIWCLDFEFKSLPGERPEIVCLVAHELHSGRRLRLWADELPRTPPFRTDEKALFVAYYAAAEMACFLQLGWPLPVRVLDLYTEFRVLTNGLSLPLGDGLLGAMSAFGLSAMAPAEKTHMRDRILAGGPWSQADKQGILAYCADDVDALVRLLPAMEPNIAAPTKRLGQALLRGRYMRAVAVMEHFGIPIDHATLRQLRRHWESLKRALIADVDQAYGVFEDGHFRQTLFLDWLKRQEIIWPSTPTGRPALDDDTFKQMAHLHPKLGDLRLLRQTLGQLHLLDVAVGRDGRNRTMLSAFRAKTSRNAPSSSRFIFGPAKWMRSLIKPEPGTALAYIDWSAQEIAIAAHLSGDCRLREAVEAGDPYIDFAKRAGLAPRDATKATHGAVRDVCKIVFLAIGYGMGADSLALQLGISSTEARHLLLQHRQAYPDLTRWFDCQTDAALLGQPLTTCFGWRLQVCGKTKPTTVRNFPVQATGAEMLRLACCLGTERGLRVVAPVHDAVLVEADTDEINNVVSLTRGAMDEASRIVLDGLAVKTDVKIMRHPERFEDRNGSALFLKIMKLLGNARDKGT